MAKHSTDEMIWRGRVHIGDEPGIFGDAQYSGLCVELPITVYRAEAFEDLEPFEILVLTALVEIYAGSGHPVTAFAFEPDPMNPYAAVQRVADLKYLTSGATSTALVVTPLVKAAKLHISVQVRADTTTTPGFYDDFQVIGLDLRATGYHYYASFGFD